MTDWYIRNMVSDQCMAIVAKMIESVGLHAAEVEPGRVQIADAPNADALAKAEHALGRAGFALVAGEREGLVNQIKCYTKRLVHHRKGEKIDVSIRSYLCQSLDMPYVQLNRLFISVEGEPLRHYIAKERVERAKQLLTEDKDKYNTTDISIDLGYNSPSNFCDDFKRVTGVTLGSYRAVGMQDRKTFLIPPG